MKKIITLCSVLLVLSIIVTAFTACGDKTEDETTATTTTQELSAEETGFTVEIGDTEAVVKKYGKEFQVLKYPVNPNFPFDKSYAQAHNEFLDMNFDGQPDFYIAVSSVDGVVNYYCWLYNATTNVFDYSIILSALKNISVDSYNQRILSTVKNGDSSLVVSYHWVDGDLVVEKKYDESTVSEEITKVVEENAIGIDKTSTTVSASGDSKETTKKSDKNSDSSVNTVSTTKANRPANTTTTKLSGGGVVLGTGDMDEGWY